MEAVLKLGAGQSNDQGKPDGNVFSRGLNVAM
jgi:hypothetical protein